MRRFRTLLITALIILSCALLMIASIPNVATGNWKAWNSMSSVRSGATAVLLSDGRVLIAGGTDANGPANSIDLVGTDGRFSSGQAMNSPRSSYAATLLQDGRVLLTGGITSGGGMTNSAEIYDPSADTWTLLSAVMVDPRSGHTASLLQDGRVLLAGGQNSGGAVSSLEIFDPANNSFTGAGVMSSPRMNHAAAVLPDGGVLIIAGSDGTNPLNSSDIYDPKSGSVSAGPNLSVPRTSLSATVTLDGKVAVIGGNNGSNDLASAEIYDPASGQFTLSGSSLATARSGHQAFLLPNNNSVLVVGGSSSGTDLNSAELYYAWADTFQPTGTMTVARPGFAGSALSVDGRFLAAGGTGLSSTELYGFATVKTDASDYPPGTTVNISGSGWQPGETVTLTLVETPYYDSHGPFTSVADASGNISNSSFVTDEHDVSIRFYLTALGSNSGVQTQNTFTDAAATTTTLTSSANPSTYGDSVTFTATTQSGGSAVTEGCITLVDGATTVGAQTAVNANGKATWTLSTLAAGSHNFQANYQDSNKAPCGTGNNFANSHANVDQSITPKALTVTGITVSDHVYDGLTSATLNFSGAALQGVVNPDTVTLNSSSYTATFASKNVGSGIAVTVSGLGLSGAQAGNYTLNQPTGLAGNITPKALTVTGITVSDHVYDGLTSATLNFSGAALQGVVNPDTVTLNSSSYTANFASKNVGSGIAVTVSGLSLSGAQAGNYTLTQPGGLTGNITPVALTAAIINDPVKTYDGNTSAALSPSNFSLSGLVGTDSFTIVKSTGLYNSADVSTATTVTASLTAGDFTPVGATIATNYTLPTTASGPGHITKASATINVAPYSLTYDGNAHIATGSAKGILNENLGGLSLVGTGHTDAGDYPTDSWTFTDATGNYNNSSGTVHDVIEKADAIIDVSGYTGVYDGNAHGATGTATGVKNEDLSSLLHVGATFTNVPGGTANWTFDGNNNYKAASGTATITITQADATINVSGFTGAYDGNAHGATGTATGVKSEDLSSLLHLGATFTNVPGGAANWTFDGNTNYKTASGTASIAITQADATINVNGFTGVYDGNAHGATGSVVGVKSEDLSSLLSFGASFTDVPGGTANWSFAGNTNYKAASGTATITITQADATINVNGFTGVYDGNAHGATGTAVGIKGEDLSGLLSLGASFNNVPGGNANWSFAGNTNYKPASGTAMIAITQADAALKVNGYTGVYDGNPHGATGTATGIKNEDLSSLLLLGATFTTVPGGTANWSFAGNTNYKPASGTATINITPADAAINVSGFTGLYDTYAHGATGTAVGVKGEDLSGLLSLGATFTDVPGGAANWSFAGNNNYKSASGMAQIIINKASSSVTVSGGGSYVYNGAAHSASVSVTGAGLSLTPAPVYSGACSTAPISVPETPCTASYTYPGDANHSGSSGSTTITITKADQTITWNSPPSMTFGAPLSGTQLNASVAGVSGGSAPGALTYTPAVGTVLGAGTQTLRVDAAATGNYNAAWDTVTIKVLYSTASCDGDAGHQILQPINATGTMSVFKLGSTVPTKFRVCDANGVSIGTPGVVIGYGLLTAASSPNVSVDEDTYSTTPDTAFRWDPSGQQWIFNQSTKNNPTLNHTSTTYYFGINLNDGSWIYFQYALK
jgi:hypothetical protein